MSDDLLSRATRALREETRDDDSGARFTRSRIMASVHEERVRTRTRLAFLIPIAATFLAASAWGAANGKLGRVVSVLSEAIGLSEAPAVPASAKPRERVRADRAPAATVPQADAPPEAPVTPPAPPVEPPRVPEAAPAAKSAPSTAHAAPQPVTNGGGPAAASDPAFDLYRAAHQAHFVERDSARALRAWDAYLRAAPNGSLALEARYNRALCLVRLHRSTEARAALRPFAEGRYGGYRKAEAAELIAALPPELAGPGDSGL